MMTVRIIANMIVVNMVDTVVVMKRIMIIFLSTAVDMAVESSTPLILMV